MPPPADLKKEKDKAKRAQERHLKVSAGVQELRLWLTDLARRGLLSLSEQPATYFDRMAARMTDAQAPALNLLIRQLGDLSRQGGQQEIILEHIGMLWLLLHAFECLDNLPESLQADVCTLIGWPQSAKDLLQNPDALTLTDNWTALARFTEVADDSLTAQYDWLYGNQTHTFALILQYSFRNAPFDNAFATGQTIAATLAFFPSARPMRAVIKEKGSVSAVFTTDQPPAIFSWAAAQNLVGEQLQTLPWITDVPMLVADLVPVQHNQERWLRDIDGRGMLCHTKLTRDRWLQLMALSGGHPATLFVLYKPDGILPLGLLSEEGGYVAL